MPDEIDWHSLDFDLSRSMEMTPSVDLLTLWRNYRHRILPGTISYHNDQLRVCVAHPFGIRWRRVFGLRWCPICNSLSPASLLSLIERCEPWDPQRARSELRSRVDQGEMDPSSFDKPLMPIEGSAFGVYTFNMLTMQPVAVNVLFHDRQYACVLGHFQDVPKRVLAKLVLHLGRIAPEVQWTFSSESGLQWSHAVPSSNLVEDEPEDDGGTEEHPPT